MATALPTFTDGDDLQTIPHSVQMKIQYGGLLGLQQLLPNAEAGSQAVEDIAQLIDDAVTTYDDVNAIPYEQLLDTIVNFKMKRRKGR